MEIHDFEHCCGAKELGSLSKDPEADLIELITNGDLEPLSTRSIPAFLIFTDAATRGYGANGEALKDFIVEKGLGHVYRTDTALNPSSRRQIAVYVWEVDQRALAAWWNHHPENPDNEAPEHVTPAKDQPVTAWSASDAPTPKRRTRGK